MVGKMTTDIERFLRCFLVAKELLNKYWLHTDGDYPEIGRIRVENVEKATEILKGASITKEIVDFKGEHLRSVNERYSDGSARIYVRANQSIEWQKYSAVKEYSHILLDNPSEDYGTDPVKILEFLTSNDPFVFEGGHTPAESSEKMAEILALEIVYPLEFRQQDREHLDSGGSISDLVEKRHVPAVHIQSGSNPAVIQGSRRIWEMLNQYSQTEQNA